MTNIQQLFIACAKFPGTILTIVLLMRAINPMNYSNEVEGYLKKLSEIDYYRRGYYNDLGGRQRYFPSILFKQATF